MPRRPIVKKEYTLGERVYLVEIAKGLRLTWKHFTFNVRASFRKGPHTVPTCWQYPEDRREIAPIFRGAHMLQLNDKGQELCVGCGMCARACPAKCITVKRGKPAEGEEDKYAGKTMCASFEVDMLRCIFCGNCEKACPKGALVLGQDYELAEYEPEKCIYDKERLLANFQRAKAEGRLKPPPKPIPVDAPPPKKKAAAGKAAKASASEKAAKGKAAAPKEAKKKDDKADKAKE
ncbi:MAG: NADH-quinone oxidoreductase subunit I [Thermodesulfobacteria bacterium]|nr:NADH-quinone oxidoreductase subunit I [Thermodesulfobacteriota bacterium]